MGLYCDIPAYAPIEITAVTPNVSDKATIASQISKTDSLAVSEMNTSEKRESLWKKKLESDGTVPLRGSRQSESDKESLEANNMKNFSLVPNIDAASLHSKNKLSMTSDQTDNPETSLGISNILAQKLSFQSENPKPVGSTVLPESEPEEDQSQVLIGTFDDHENVSFTEEELQRIAQTYDVFYYNRLHSSKSLSKKGNQSYSDLSFEPEILDYSRQLAFNYREKQLQSLEEIITNLKGPVPPDGKVTHADLLIYKGLSTRNKLSQQRQKSIEKQLEACTFQPNILASVRTPGKQNIKGDKENRIHQYHSKGEELYNLAKQSKKVKADRSARDIEYQKNNEDCTFKPNLEKSTRSQSRTKKKSLNTSKDFEKSVERLRKGREQREQVRMATEIRAQNPNDKKSQFKFTLEKMGLGKKEAVPLARNLQSDLNSAEGEVRYNKRPSSLSYLMRKKDDSSFLSSDPRENQTHNLFQEIERQIYQANVENNDKILNDSLTSQKTTKFTGQTFGSTIEDQTSVPKKVQEKVPLLYVDVNFGGTKSERILVYEGDTAEGLAMQFSLRNNLNDHLRTKLTMLLQSHMSGILSKIEEEMPSTQSEIHRVPPTQSVYNKFR